MTCWNSVRCQIAKRLFMQPALWNKIVRDIAEAEQAARKECAALARKLGDTRMYPAMGREPGKFMAQLIAKAIEERK